MLLGKARRQTPVNKVSQENVHIFQSCQGWIIIRKRLIMSAINSLAIHGRWKIKVGISFLFDIMFIFDFDVCVRIEENLVLNQEVA